MSGQECAASHEKVLNGLGRFHTKRRMGMHGRAHSSFGMAKEGWACMVAPILLLVWHRLFGYFFWGGGLYIFYFIFLGFFLSWCRTKRTMGCHMCTHRSFGITMTHLTHLLCLVRNNFCRHRSLGQGNVVRKQK